MAVVCEFVVLFSFFFLKLPVPGQLIKGGGCYGDLDLREPVLGTGVALIFYYLGVA